VAVKLADAVAYLGTDDSKLQSGLNQAHGRVSAWGEVLTGALRRVGEVVTDAIGNVIRGAVDNLAESVGLASDLSETVSKVGVLFGDQQGVIVEWSKSAATAFGQTQQQALDAAANFGIFGKAAGLTGEDLTAFSQDFTELASDLASFNNTSPEQAVQAIGAALRGESEPLRQYGVLLNDAALKAAAFEMGLTHSNTENLTQQQKILAAQKVIFDQTTSAQGDFQRTAEGLANQQRTLAAQAEDFKTQLGTSLLPVVNTVAGAANALMERFAPALIGFMNQYVVPFTGHLAERLATAFEEFLPRLDAWKTDALAFVSEFVGGWKTGKETTTSYADELGVSVGQSVDAVRVGMEGLRESMSEFASWFASPEAGQPASWWMRIADMVLSVIKMFGELLGIEGKLAGVMGKLFRGDFGGANQAADEAEGYLNEVLQRIMQGINNTRELWGAQPFDLSPYYQNNVYLPTIQNSGAGQTMAPQNSNSVYMPIIINASGADANALAAAAQAGVTQALRQAGLQ
jgi:hypothetical protein